MKRQPCPTNQLTLLIRDDLPAPVTEQIQAHLETCENCQQQLESLAADENFWGRASAHLSATSDFSNPDWSASSDSIVVRLDSPRSESISPVSNSPSLDPARHPEMLGRIDTFDVECKIGQGGMGVVYRGFDSSLNRPVAIKILAPHLASSGVARKRFAREAQAAAAVVHPNVVPIYSVNQDRPYIVMALVDGRSLQDHVAENGPLETKDIVRVAHQIASGLAAAHRQGLIHRDIKPANILLEKDVSRVMITDFGLARAADDVAMTQTGWLAGTPHYMSPEQARGNDIDRRSDLFSLGSLIYFMSTGREPFRAEKPLAILEKIYRESPLPARSVNCEIPKTLDRIITRLLQKNPDDRMESAEQLETILAQYLAHLQHPQSSAKPKVSPNPGQRRRVKLASMIMAGVTFFLVSLLILASTAPWSAPRKTPTLNQPLSAPTPSDDSTEWMIGLQSFDEWANDATLLEQDIELLERQIRQNESFLSIPDSGGFTPHDEIYNLENQINQLQQNLLDSEEQLNGKGN